MAKYRRSSSNRSSGLDNTTLPHKVGWVSKSVGGGDSFPSCMPKCKCQPSRWILIVVLGPWLLALNAPAQVTVNLFVTSPASGALVGDDLKVIVGATSTYEIQSVTATVADRVTNLVYTTGVGWTGDLGLSGLSRGAQTLKVNAIDAFGNSGQTQVSFIYDRPPQLAVLEPTNLTLARPQLRVRATASDDDPVGTVVRVYRYSVRGSTLLASGTTNLDSVVDLSPWDGMPVDIEFDATDSAGQTTTLHRSVDVVANTNVVEVDRVSGQILDVSADAILFVDGSVLKSKSRLSGVETILFDSQGQPSGDAHLTPYGAIFGSGQTSELYEFRDGTLIDLGQYQGALVAKGNYAIWIVGMETLMFRDFLAGTNVVVSTSAGNIYDDVAANGDVVYWGGNDYQIYRYRNGTSSHLASGVYPLTDGTNVAYFTGSPLAFPDLGLFDGTNQIVLAPRMDTPALNAGWTAYTKPGNGATQVWTRSPSGIQSQRTFFGISSYLYGLAPNGDIMINAGSRLYFVFNGSTLRDFGGWGFEGPFWRDGNWYAAMGGSLVAIMVPSPVTISSPRWTTNGQFSFSVLTSIGQQVIAQESTNLLTWVSVSTNQVIGTAGIQMSFPVSGVSEKKFYRVMTIQ